MISDELLGKVWSSHSFFCDILYMQYDKDIVMWCCLDIHLMRNGIWNQTPNFMEKNICILYYIKFKF